MNINRLVKIPSDTTGTQLFINPNNKNLYFADQNSKTATVIKKMDGTNLSQTTEIDEYDIFIDTKGIAIEKQDLNYLLAIKITAQPLDPSLVNLINGSLWTLYTIGNDGIIKDEKILTSIKSEESNFEQDVDGDERIGLSIDILTKKESDTVGTQLFIDSDKFLYFADENGNKPIPIIDEDGDQLKDTYFSYEDNFDNRIAIAIEKQSDDNYLLAVRNKVKITTDQLNIDKTEWILYTIDQYGKIKDEKKLSSIEFKSEESKFKQDVDSDKGIGVSIDIFTKKESDTVGTQLFVNYNNNISSMGATLREGDLYFVDDENDTIPKPILDKDGDKLKEKYASYNGFVSDLKAIAIEKQSDDNYLLLMIHTILGGYSFTEYTLYTIEPDGKVIDKKEFRNIGSLRYNEYNFKQDLNNDRKIGIDGLENIDNIKTKLLVEVERRQSKYGITSNTNVFHLYFQPEDSQIPKPIIEQYSDDIFKLNDWIDYIKSIDPNFGSGNQNVYLFPIAIEKLTENAKYKGKVIAEKGEYLLLLKEPKQKSIDGFFGSSKEDRSRDTESAKRARKEEEWGYYELYVVSSNGKIKSLPIVNISYYDINELEKYFGTDINNDFQYNGTDSTEDPINKGFKLRNINTDTNGVKLLVNKDSFLFIEDEDEDNLINFIPIKSKKYIKDIDFTYLDNFKVPPGNGLNKNAYAVEKIQQDNITYRNQVIALKGDYLLAVKKERKAFYNLGTNVNWDLYVLENTGFDAILKKTLINVPVKDFEQYFNQDLNEDGNIGKVTSKQNTRNQLKNKTSLKVHEVFTLHNKKTINMKTINMKTNN